MSLQGYIDRRVLLILQDGRAIVVSNDVDRETQANCLLGCPCGV